MRSEEKVFSSMTIGERLKYAREAMGYKQTQLAEKIGLTQSAISNIETDSSRKPSAPTLLKLAAALEISPQWLMDGKGDMRKMPALTGTTEEDLLATFRQLTPESKMAIMAAVHAMK